MSRILCPECGTKISDKATKCPHCGFQSADPKRPISEQDKYEMVPIFEYDIEEWQPNRGELSIISYEDNRSLIQYFGKWENIKVLLLNENSSQKRIEVVDQFTDIAARITAFDPKAQIEYSVHNLLTAETEHTGGDSDEQ